MTDTKAKPAKLSKSFARGPEITIDFPEAIALVGGCFTPRTSEQELQATFREMEMTPENEAMIRKILTDMKDDNFFKFINVYRGSIVLFTRPAYETYKETIEKFRAAVPGEVVDDPPFDGVGISQNGFAGD